jgi:hypothetical protein
MVLQKPRESVLIMARAQRGEVVLMVIVKQPSCAAMDNRVARGDFRFVVLAMEITAKGCKGSPARWIQVGNLRLAEEGLVLRFEISASWSTGVSRLLTILFHFVI